MISTAFEAITMKECATCKACCSDLHTSGDRSEILCAFNCISEINQNKIPDDIIKRLVIYSVPDSQMDHYAKYLRMFPLTNLLRHMTIPDKNGKYEFLAIPPAVIDKCPFLSPCGCNPPDIKNYICGIYPFYVHKLQFHSDYNCPWLDNLNEEDDVKYREIVGKYIVDYLFFSENHKTEYALLLNQIKQKNNLRVLSPEM